jgi:RNA polymerase sigma factor (sigma-70 family)
MAASPDTLLQYIHRMVARPEPDEATDAALLGRFISARDEKAFVALVDRHGPLVLQVCRRVLGNGADAEDAFQATFLVLARKAATVARREALPAWLHGVARRVALKARSAQPRPLRDARPLAAAPADPRPDPLAEISGRELLMIIDEEMKRLPEAYRLPLILCCLEGRNLDEAAQQLGWTPGSVKGRLERGRARLHERLLRRGLTLSSALAAAEVSRGEAAAVVARLVARTAPGAMAFGAHQAVGGEGVSTVAAALAGNVVKDMALARPKLVAALLLTSCLLAMGFFINRATRAPALTTPAAVFKNRPAASTEDAPIEVSGRVLDPEGRPFVGARLYVGYSERRYARRFATRSDFRPMSYPLRATSDADGRFHFTFATSELDARWLDDSRPAVIAVAGGYGPDWAVIGDPGQGAGLSLQLVEDHPISGRLVDQNRKPVAGARVLVRDVLSASQEGVTRYLRGDFRADFTAWLPRNWRGPLPGQPPGVTTAADGRFRLTGLGRDRIVRLALEGPTIEHAVIEAVARPTTPYLAGVRGATFDYPTRPARLIRGRVRDRATGRPLAGVKVSAHQTDATAVTDSDGRFEILGCSKRQPGYFILAQPQSGQPYFAAAVGLPDGPGLGPATVNFELVSGIPLSGRVTDQATHKPPRAGVVEYYALFPNPYSARIASNIFQAASSAVIQPDGSYRLVVLPGPGVVCVAALPRASYAVALVDEQDLANIGIKPDRCLRTAGGAVLQGSLWVNKYNGLSLIHPHEKAEFLALDFTLQPAPTLEGIVVGPDGQPLTGARVSGLTAMPDEEILEGASFTVTGLNPRRARTLLLHHKGKGLGKVLTVHAGESGPLTVQLEACGSVLGRVVHEAGKPAPKVTVAFFGAYGAEAWADTDRQGRFRVDGLVPGQKYSLTLSSGRLHKDVGEVQVESGRRKDLGDLVLEH